jgi:cobaltochelatase CobS
MHTLHHLSGSSVTYPDRHELKRLGLKWDTAAKMWWATDRDAVQAAVLRFGGTVLTSTVADLPRFKPRGRSFKRGQDTRREGSSSNGTASGVTAEAETETDTDDESASAYIESDETDDAQDNAAQQLAAAVRALAGGAVDRRTVERLVAEATADLRAKVDGMTGSSVVRVVVERPNVEPQDCGVQHRHFPILLTACNARTSDGHRLNVWLVGPAGTGKTRAALEVAKALGLSFWSNGALASKYELLGYADANRVTHRTPFREAWEHGGVFLWDEIDGSDNNAVLAFNQGLANGVIPFPDGMVPRHVDCVVIAGANSANGGTANYNGRIRQDGAFLDRFVYLDWPLDEALETAIAPNAQWCRRVQQVRRTVAERGVQGHLVTPRATLYGAALLAAGLDATTVETMVLRKALSDEQWATVRGSV